MSFTTKDYKCAEYPAKCGLPPIDYDSTVFISETTQLPDGSSLWETKEYKCSEHPDKCGYPPMPVQQAPPPPVAPWKCDESLGTVTMWEEKKEADGSTMWTMTDYKCCEHPVKCGLPANLGPNLG